MNLQNSPALGLGCGTAVVRLEEQKEFKQPDEQSDLPEEKEVEVKAKQRSQEFLLVLGLDFDQPLPNDEFALVLHQLDLK